MSEIQVYNMTGEAIETIDWNAAEGVREATVVGVLHQTVTAQQAAQRQGTADTKTRGEVRGGGKKPWRQKGTGRARQGSRRAPHWTGGGTVFGPHPRSYDQKVSRKVGRLARKSAWLSKFADGEVLILDRLELESGKTRDLVEVLDHFELGSKLLLVPVDAAPMLDRAARNLQGVSVIPFPQCSVLDLMRADTVMTTKAVMESVREGQK
jgi:large subunit ribosomal protein L4